MAMHTVGLPTIWNPLDPFGSLADDLRNAYKAQENWLSNFLANPPRYSDKGILPDLYQIGSINAEYLVFGVFLLAVMIGVALMRGETMARAFMAWILVSLLAPVFVQVINGMANTGNSVTADLNFYNPPNQPDPPIDNALIGGLIFLLNWLGSFALSGVAISYEPIIVFVKFWGLIAMGMWALGKRTRQMTEIIIALGIVATLLGRPVAQFILEIGQIMRSTFPGGNTLVLGGILTMISIALAIVSQVVLVFACYKGVQGIEGRIRSLVKGTVVTTIKNTIKVDLNKLRKQQPPPVPMYNVAPPGPTTRDHIHRAGRAAGRKASSAVGAAATAAGHPAIGLVVAKGGNHKFRENKPPKRR